MSHCALVHLPSQSLHTSEKCVHRVVGVVFFSYLVRVDEGTVEGQASMSNAETKPTPGNDSGGGICTLIKNQSQLLSGNERMSHVNAAGSWEGCQEKQETGGRAGAQMDWASVPLHGWRGRVPRGVPRNPCACSTELAVRQHLGTDLTVHRVAPLLKVTAHGVLWRAQKEHRVVSRVEK